jgi:hypothetical protein
MQLKRIQVGHWYETRAGVGVAERVGGTFPPSVGVRAVVVVSVARHRQPVLKFLQGETSGIRRSGARCA